MRELDVTAGTKLHLLVAALTLCEHVDVEVNYGLGTFHQRISGVTVTRDEVIVHSTDGQRMHFSHVDIPAFRGGPRTKPKASASKKRTRSKKSP